MHTVQTPAVTMVPATSDDLRALERILNEAREWLARVGVPQWQAPFDKVELLTDIESGRVVLAFDPAGDLVGSLQLSYHPEFPWDDAPGEAAYIHRLVVSVHAMGSGIGSAMLDWASLQAASKGLPFIKLFCARDNARLNAHYRALGFEHAGEAEVERAIDGVSVPVSLLERKVPLP